jgi:hypothetical protein
MARRFDIRKELFRMVALIVVLDAAAVAGYHYTRLRDASANAKLTFTALWTAVTLVVVLTSLRRIRLARDARAGGPPRRGARGR